MPIPKTFSEKNGWVQGLLYKYVIEDVIYYGSRISGNVEFTFNIKSAARYFGKKYTLGQKVNVYYNPRDYYESVLVNTFGFLNYIPLFIAAVFFYIIYVYLKLIEKAKEKLSVTNLSVSEIAFALGFEHSQSFSKLFRVKTGVSPLDFRQSFN